MISKKRNIFHRLIRRLDSELDGLARERSWRKWLRAEKDALDKRSEADFATWPRRPLLSVILPVYNIHESFLEKCIDSVVGQEYPDWELCIADDASTTPGIREVLERAATRDSRIKIVFRPTNGNISAASNSALSLATGEFCVFLDHDDTLVPHALGTVAERITENPDAAIIYSDENKIDANGRRYGPTFKPDWSRDLFYSVNYLNHLSAIRTSLVHDAGDFRLGFEGSQDYDLLLRCIEKIREDQIVHIPEILYHWRAIPGSVAFDGDEKPYAKAAAEKAIAEHFERTGVAASVEGAMLGSSRVTYDLPQPLPSVSVIVWGGDDGDKHLADLQALTDYSTFEIVRAEPDGNLARSLNAAASSSSSQILCFLINGLRPRHEDWLRRLVGFAIQPAIGAVGAKVTNARGKVLDGALTLDRDQLLFPQFRGRHSETAGHLGRNLFIGNYSAVSLSALAVRRDLFEEIGKFDEINLPNSFGDADLCLRLGESGYRIAFDPIVEMTASASTAAKIKPTKIESEYFENRWAAKIANDPFHNPNLETDDRLFKLASLSRKS